MSLQRKKIIPQGAEVDKTLKLRIKLNLKPTWKIGHMLPTGNRIYSGPKLGYNPENLPRGKPFLFIVLFAVKHFPWELHCAKL